MCVGIIYIYIYCACIYVFNCVLSIVAKGESTNIRRMLASNNDDKTKRLVLKMFSPFQHKKDTAVQQDSSFLFHSGTSNAEDKTDICKVYPLVMTNIAMVKMAHGNRWFTY